MIVLSSQVDLHSEDEQCHVQSINDANHLFHERLLVYAHFPGRQWPLHAEKSH